VERLPEHDHLHGGRYLHQRVPDDDRRLRPVPQGTAGPLDHHLQQSIPQELLEASLVDGCSYARFFWEVVVPLSGAIIAVLALLYSVAHWNSFFTGLIYLQDYSKYPLQLILRDILIGMQAAGASDDAKTIQEMQRIADLMRYALIIVASFPVMILYPFLQRYFVKGVMVGAIKG
jgi:putative aldouronate transport system permease protein